MPSPRKFKKDPLGDDEIEALDGSPSFPDPGSALPKNLPEGAARVGEAGAQPGERGPRPKSDEANFKMGSNRGKSADRPDRGLYDHIHFMKNAMAMSDGPAG